MKKSTLKQYRHGDVLLERVAKIPARDSLRRVPPENCRVVLAHGEVTGHAHVFDVADVTKFESVQGQEFFEVIGRKLEFRLPVVRRWRNQVMVKHPELGLIEFAVQDVQLRGDDVEVSGKFGLLKHDEHTAQGIPAGLYRGGSAGEQVRQREYSLGEARYVQD